MLEVGKFLKSKKTSILYTVLSIKGSKVLLENLLTGTVKEFDKEDLNNKIKEKKFILGTVKEVYNEDNS